MLDLVSRDYDVVYQVQVNSQIIAQDRENIYMPRSALGIGSRMVECHTLLFQKPDQTISHTHRCQTLDGKNQDQACCHNRDSCVVVVCCKAVTQVNPHTDILVQDSRIPSQVCRLQGQI